MQRFLVFLLCGALVLSLGACKPKEADRTPVPPQVTSSEAEATVDGLEHPTAADSDTIKWLNAAYAPYILVEGSKDFQNFGGGRRTGQYVRQITTLLKTRWNIIDRATLDQRMLWQREHGQCKDFANAVKQLREKDALELPDAEFMKRFQEEYNYDFKAAHSWLNVAKIYQAHGEDAMDAWDKSQTIRMAGYGYIAGYYTFEEAVALAVEAGKLLQQSYGSWDEMMASYMLGDSFVTGEMIAEGSMESKGSRFSAYNRLKAMTDSIYTVDWNTPLEPITEAAN